MSGYDQTNMGGDGRYALLPRPFGAADLTAAVQQALLATDE